MRTLVTASASFEAAHSLPLHPGRCKRLHGHHYRIEVSISGAVGPDGVVLDFDELANILRSEVLQRWDHQLLNDLVDNPTAELLAQEAFKLLAAAGLAVVSVKLWETPDFAVEVSAR